MYIITGSGISSLFLAELLVRKIHNGKKIILVESSDLVGGLFGTLRHDECTTFDIGMHTVQLTGNSEIDEIIEAIYSKDDWYRYKAPLHDISGTIIGTQIFENSPYFDLDYFDKEVKNKLSFELKEHLSKKRVKNLLEADKFTNASSFLNNQFGKILADSTYIEALRQRYRTTAENLDPIATKLTPMNRLASNDLFSEREILENYDIRSTIAWPNQRNLPSNLSSNLDVIYPRNSGIHLLIDKMKKKLVEQGVRILTNSKIVKIEIKDNRAKVVFIEQQSKTEQFEVDNLFWAGNVSNLIGLLDVHKPNYVPDNPLQTVIATIKSDSHSIRKSDCLYYFSYLNKNGLYRLNNYAAYYEHFNDKNQGLISMEYLIPKEITLTRQQVIGDLTDFQFVDGLMDPGQVKIHYLPFGHPYPSSNNISVESNLLEKFTALNVLNIKIFGSSLSQNRFFQKDILLNLREVLAHV